MGKLRTLLPSGLGIFLLFFVVAYVWSHQQHLKNEQLAQSLLAQIAAAPNDTRLRTNICDLLNTGDLSSSNGNLLLKALVGQHFIQRETYLAGHPINVRLFIDNRPSIGSYAFGFRVKAMAGSEDLGKVEGPIGLVGAPCEFYRGLTSAGKVVSTDAAGEYDGSIVITYSLYKRMRRRWDWPSYGPFPKNLLPRRERVGRPGATPNYQCDINMPVHFRVTPAPEIQWTNSPELDEKVNQAFKYDPTGWLKLRQNSYFLPAAPPPVFRKTGDTNTSWHNPAVLPNSPDMDCDMRLLVSNAPVNLAFSTSFRDASGVEHPSKTFRITARKSKVYAYILQQASDDFGGLPPGHYKGDLILKADKSVAYDNLEIKDIWNGTLSFPVEFDIKPKPAN
jgi:hypothetical protein